MNHLEQQKAKAREKSRNLLVPGVGVRYLTLEDVDHIIETTHTAAIEEVVRIIESAKLESSMPHEYKINPSAWGFGEKILAHTKKVLIAAIKQVKQ